MLLLISATDWIWIGIVALVIVGLLVMLNHITKPYDVKTEDEFEARRKQIAGMKGLQEILDPSVKKAVEVQQDIKRGIYDDKEEADDPPEGGGRQEERKK